MTVPSKAHTWTNWRMAQICQRVELQLVLGDSNAASPHTLAVSALAVQLLLPAHQVLLARPLVLAQHELTRKKFLNDNFNLGSLSLLCQGGKLVARGGKHSDCWLYLMHMAWQPAQLLWTLILVVASRNTRARMAAHTERDADEPRDVLAAVNDDAAHFNSRDSRVARSHPYAPPHAPPPWPPAPPQVEETTNHGGWTIKVGASLKSHSHTFFSHSSHPFFPH